MSIDIAALPSSPSGLGWADLMPRFDTKRALPMPSHANQAVSRHSVLAFFLSELT
jgi:hypothetical protein